MSNVPEIVKEDIKIFRAKLIYLFGQANAIIEFCLLAEQELKDNNNELKKYAFKKMLKKMKYSSRVLEDIVHSNDIF